MSEGREPLAQTRVRGWSCPWSLSPLWKSVHRTLRAAVGVNVVKSTRMPEIYK